MKNKLLPVVAVGLLAAAIPLHAAVITFDDLITGQTSYGFDGDGDGIDDVTFSTTDPSGFNTVGPGTDQIYIDEPGLEGTSELNPDLRVDFAFGATGSLSFGFALNSTVSDSAYFASLSVYDAASMLIGSSSVVGTFSPSLFPEGEVSVPFSGEAAYALFDFTSEFGRYIIDNFEGTYGSTEVPPQVPEPGTLALLGLGLAGLGLSRRRLAA